ncbi:DNA-directed RNA polymerase I subunit RPA43 [Fusarium tjaetaba]|uniref:DNA-directed RNA polymerase subunit n=1 Tax=Fusarium tjaetaba TaxID=1567544 RepID=A0A8H5QX24_9HYPO|nr:DNA-directed RNA polymerase I subunit RPA43 [Fusarium tjaetaba]KAF5622620.1 DNA-directed RNA polymerase I subunit RPA43 [Fusarium tjaetaba]
MAPIDPAASKAEKKAKKEKKRAREEDAVADTERKHKKSKSVAAAEAPEASSDLKAEKKKKKSKKDKHAEDAVAQPETEAPAVEDKPEKKHKKKKHHDAEVAATEEADTPVVADSEKKKKSKKHKETEAIEIAERPKKSKKNETAVEPEEDASPADPDAMDVDMPPPAKPSKSSSNIYQPPDIPANPQFPFFTQTVSLYEPLFPIGWAQPVTNCQQQHLSHLRNKYVPSLRGVLLDYKNVAFGENPGRKGAATDDESPATVMAKGESAVGFGWITADVDLFVPSRGAWMEGSVNLQTEGHIGVVCFGKFNASIEARRLPPDWKWVPNESPEAQGFEETASVITADDHGVVRQIHSTGFWADGNGDKVKGKIRFRIRNFDVGTSGETSYLSLEGTMLDKAGEKAVVAEEAETAKMRKGKKGSQRVQRRRIPEFAMTRFAVEGEEQTEDNEAEKREVLALPEDL